jgi:hypothetical protein
MVRLVCQLLRLNKCAPSARRLWVLKRDGGRYKCGKLVKAEDAVGVLIERAQERLKGLPLDGKNPE